MNPAISALARSRSESMREQSVISSSLSDFHSTLQAQTTRSYFGQIEPIYQRAFRSPESLVHSPHKWDLDIAPQRYWPPYRGVYTASRRRQRIFISSIGTIAQFDAALTWPSVVGTSHHLTDNFEESSMDSLSWGDLPARQKPTNVSEAIPQLPVFVIPAFMYLEHAKHLLNQHRIGEARGVLGRGAVCYPEDDKIGGLLRTISRGRVSRKIGVTKGRRQEIDWLKRHGQAYRDRWVAIRGDQLMASAINLTELLANIEAQKGTTDLPLIQYVAPE